MGWDQRRLSERRRCEGQNRMFLSALALIKNSLILRDIAIEVVQTRDGINKLDIFYKGLNVSEVWFWKKNQFSVYSLRDGDYEQVDRSQVLPNLDLTLLAKYTQHMVIEVIVTSGTINRKELYKPLSIPEIWFWRSKQLRMFQLQNGEYVEVSRSQFFPDLDLALVTRYLDHPDQYDAVQEFLAEVRQT